MASHFMIRGTLVSRRFSKKLSHIEMFVADLTQLIF